MSEMVPQSRIEKLLAVMAGYDGITPEPPQSRVEVLLTQVLERMENMTPVRGVDYWTAEDIAEIKGYVDDAIINGRW